MVPPMAPAPHTRNRMGAMMARKDVVYYLDGSAHSAIVRVVTSRTLVSDRLGRGADVDCFAGFVILAVMLREIVLGIEVRAADDAVVLVGVCHWTSKVWTGQSGIHRAEP